MARMLYCISLTGVAAAVWPWDSTDHLQRFEHLCGLHLGRYVPTLKDTVYDDGQPGVSGCLESGCPKTAVLRLK